MMNRSVPGKRISGVFNYILSRRIIAIIILVTVSAGIYLPSLKNEFVWDDIPYIVNRVQKLNIHTQISEMFKESSNKGVYYRPILHLSLSIDKKLWGLSPFGYHLTNVLLHSLATILFYVMCLTILGRFGIKSFNETAFLSSIIFALHPIHVEAVSFIMARSDLLCSIFLLGTFIAYVKSYDYSRVKNLLLILLSLILFYFGLLSKEVAYFFPATVLTYDLIFHHEEFKRCLYRYLPAIVTGVFYVYIRIKSHIVLPDINSFIKGNTNIVSVLLKYTETILNSIGYCVYKLTFPFYFNASPGEKDLNIIFILMGFLLLISIVALAVRRRNNFEKLVLFLLIWVVVYSAPGIIGSLSMYVRTPFADRFLYLPSAGYCVLLVLVIVSLRSIGSSIYLFYTSIISICLIGIVFATFTFKEQFNWKDNLTLWRVTSNRSPGEMMPLVNYGMSLLVAGKTDEAINMLEKSLETKSRTFDNLQSMALNNLGIAYLSKHDYQRAETYFKKTMDFNPNYIPTSYFHLGLLYYLKGNDIEQNNKEAALPMYREAEKYLLKSHKIKPTMGRLNLLLAEVYLKLNMPLKAKKYATQSLTAGRLILDKEMQKRAVEIINKY